MNADKKAYDLITEHTPLDVLQTLAHVVYNNLPPFKILIVAGQPRTGKTILGQLISVASTGTQILDLDRWHVPIGDISLDTLETHCTEWAPKASVYQFRKVGKSAVNLDIIQRLAHDKSVTVVLYVDDVSNIKASSDKLLKDVALINLTDIIDDEQADDTMYTRLISESRDIRKDFEKYYDVFSELPAQFKTATEAIQIIPEDKGVNNG